MAVVLPVWVESGHEPVVQPVLLGERQVLMMTDARRVVVVTPESKGTRESYQLDEMKADSVMVPGEVGVIYFFAPWCFYCRSSIDNLDELVESGELAWARVVALEYESLDDIREFIRETGVHLPVLLGGPKTTSDWQIRGFPTYFVIDGTGKIVSRSVGYSTKIGLQTRVWINQD